MKNRIKLFRRTQCKKSKYYRFSLIETQYTQDKLYSMLDSIILDGIYTFNCVKYLITYRDDEFIRFELYGIDRKMMNKRLGRN